MDLILRSKWYLLLPSWQVCHPYHMMNASAQDKTALFWHSLVYSVDHVETCFQLISLKLS